ncbi:MAG: cation acetate symporter [Gammaproteobacteria bacterium]|nr:MAG: cation acetate symporter [Gammaproteobacteria bacterium]
MDLQTLTYLFVGLSFVLYISIAVWSRAGSTKEFYVAGGGVPPIANGMATGADWMSAASFVSMAGLIAFMGRDGSMFLMGWTGGYVLLAMLLAPYLRKFGRFTVPEFIGDRYYSDFARVVAVICLIVVSFTYVIGQMRGVGIVFARFLQVEIETGIFIGMLIVFTYAVFGGMKGITYTQVAQYVIMIFAYSVPAIFLSLQITGHFFPQTGLGGNVVGTDTHLLKALDQSLVDLGFSEYTSGIKPKIDVFAITAALMFGTAGLPHVIVRFFTVPRVKDARSSAGWALFFIALLYTTAGAVGAFARHNIIDTVNTKENTGTAYTAMPQWFTNWENSGLISWYDHNGDGKVQYAAGNSLASKKPVFSGESTDPAARGQYGQRIVTNPSKGQFDEAKQPFANELYVDRDIMVLANPEIAKLPNWVIALVAAGAMAAALSTAAGLLLVISTAVAHDLLKKTIVPSISERGELLAARLSAAAAIGIAGYFGLNPPGYVAALVALAFGLASASFFPAIILGIFNKKMNRAGAVTGMIIGIGFTLAYIIAFKFMGVSKEYYLFGISPEGIGFIGMILNFVVAFVINKITGDAPAEIQEMVEDIRVPKRKEGDLGSAHVH